MLNSTKQVNGKAVSIPSTPTTPAPSMFIVTKRQPVEVGQCSKRDWTARLISTAAGTPTKGFGNLNGEFWLGLDKIYRLTKERSRLHVDLEETTGKTAYAEYDFFGVASERSKYKLSLGTYSGKLGSYKNHCIVLSSGLVFLSFFFKNFFSFNQHFLFQHPFTSLPTF